MVSCEYMQRSAELKLGLVMSPSASLYPQAEERGFNGTIATAYHHQFAQLYDSGWKTTYDKPFPKDLDGPPGGRSLSAEAGNSSGRKAERDLGKKALEPEDEALHGSHAKK